MASLSYSAWSATCDTLHAHAQVLGKIAVTLAPPEPQLQHGALRLTARGWESALLPAVEAFGLRVDDSEAGLYLLASAGEPGRVTIERLAAHGILAAPGDFYGPAGAQHVRIALTATDERVAAAVRRLGRPREA